MKRSMYAVLSRHMERPRKFIQLLTGPRQTGKTTIVLDYARAHEDTTNYFSVDDFPIRSIQVIDDSWETVRVRLRMSGKGQTIIFDELQKINGWSEAVKRNWDRDTREGYDIKVIITGSSRLMLQRKMGESLLGRYQTIFVPHWSYPEMHAAFGFSFEKYVFFGGYPGAVDLIDDEREWRRYINSSIIEPILSQDILLLTPVDKPALLRQVADLSSLYSGQILSFNKMQGQLQEAGNLSTIANYLGLLDEACFSAGLNNYSHGRLSERTSIPKLQVYTNSLLSARMNRTFQSIRTDSVIWGRFFESCIGSALISYAKSNEMKLLYWRDCGKEVDFVVDTGDRTVGIEVKSGHSDRTSGLAAFRKAYPDSVSFVISESGAEGIKAEEFLENIDEYLNV